MYFVMNYDNVGGPPLNVRVGGYIHLKPAMKKAQQLTSAVIINEKREVVHALRNGRVL